MNPDQPLSLLGGLTAREFLRDYWQKKPLLVRKALPDFSSPISADELAGLALEEDVESRLILEHGTSPWELRHGPFDEETFQHLPERDWTLLVQAVDQWVPEVAELKQAFHFLPSWRMDDVMISYATDGGGVGPHYDNYDVFLLQAEGRRRWRIGEVCNSDSPLRPHDSLKILESFEPLEDWVLEPGDLLYLPPRVAHYGTAVGECMTWSFGFRSPAVTEVLTHFTDFLGQFISDDERYTDADLAFSADPHRVDPGNMQRLKALLSEHLQDERMLLTWFGQYMTEPRYPDQITASEWSQTELPGQLQQGLVLMQNPCGRLAWSEIDLGVLLFASGHSRLLSAELKDLVTLLCEAQALHQDNLAPWLKNAEALQLLTELLRQGSLCVAGDDDDEA